MRPRIHRTTKVLVRSSLEFIRKLRELGYTKQQALARYKFINAKCEGKLHFR